jgi:hypothetical protein
VWRRALLRHRNPIQAKYEVNERDGRTCFASSRRIVCGDQRGVRLLPQFLLAFLHRLRRAEPSTVRLYKLVSHGLVPPEGGPTARTRSGDRASARFLTIASDVTLTYEPTYHEDKGETDGRAVATRIDSDLVCPPDLGTPQARLPHVNVLELLGRAASE